VSELQEGVSPLPATKEFDRLPMQVHTSFTVDICLRRRFGLSTRRADVPPRVGELGSKVFGLRNRAFSSEKAKGRNLALPVPSAMRHNLAGPIASGSQGVGVTIARIEAQVSHNERIMALPALKVAHFLPTNQSQGAVGGYSQFGLVMKEARFFSPTKLLIEGLGRGIINGRGQHEPDSTCLFSMISGRRQQSNADTLPSCSHNHK
jgi:hypothetical protein